MTTEREDGTIKPSQPDRPTGVGRAETRRILSICQCHETWGPDDAKRFFFKKNDSYICHAGSVNGFCAEVRGDN